MAKEKMSKKLRQAVDYANATDTTKGVGNPPNTSKKKKKDLCNLNKWRDFNGQKNRNRINAPKKNNHTPPEAIEAEQIAHGKEFSAAGGRKNGPGHNE